MSCFSVAFVCVENAGRSQMARAIAEEIVRERDLDVDVYCGGTQPSDKLHVNVVRAMAEFGVDVSGRRPRKIGFEELESMDIVVSMGCSGSACPSSLAVETREWDLEDPAGKGIEEVCKIRDEIENLVRDLLESFF
nr:low molecular weight phosphatase family protein [Methanonatronarchaeum thermophilum]